MGMMTMCFVIAGHIRAAVILIVIMGVQMGTIVCVIVRVRVRMIVRVIVRAGVRHTLVAHLHRIIRRSIRLIQTQAVSSILVFVRSAVSMRLIVLGLTDHPLVTSCRVGDD